MLAINQLENFGPIEKIIDSIELNNLTIFMGDNSSGKSYLAMLISALFSMEKGYRDSNLVKALNGKFHGHSFLVELQKISENLVHHYDETATLEIEQEEFLSLKEIALFSLNYLAKKYLVEKIFGNNISIQNLDINISKVDKKNFSSIELKLTKKDGFIIFTLLLASVETRIMFQDKIDKNLLSNRIQELILTALVHGLIKKSTLLSSVYIPASRTGYLQTYKVLTNKAIESVYYRNSKETEIDENNKLNIFITQFLQYLNINTPTSEHAIAHYIESNILKGKVLLSQDSNDINFELLSGENVDLNYLSSTVSELIPLVVFLKRGLIRKTSLCIIEEPEAHLSFKNQRLMANILAQFVQQGIKVLITTHSDFLIYELNNLMMKHTILAKKNTLEKTKHDLPIDVQKKLDSIDSTSVVLDYKKVSLYNFELQSHGKSIVNRIKINEFGIASDYILNNTYSLIKEKNSLEEILDF